MPNPWDKFPRLGGQDRRAPETDEWDDFPRLDGKAPAEPARKVARRPEARALGRAGVELAAGAVEAPGTIARVVTGTVAEKVASVATGIEALAPRATRTVSESELLSPGVRERLDATPPPSIDTTKIRTQRIREAGFDVGEKVAQPFERAAAKIRTAKSSELLRKVYNLDPDRPLKEKLTDSRWWREEFVESAGSAVAFLLPGVGASKIGRLAGLGRLQARNLGFGVASGLIFASETGSSTELRDELVSNGAPIETATLIASRGKLAYGAASALIERGILPAQFTSAGRGVGGWFMRLIAGGAGEVTEEEAQMLTFGLARYSVGLDPDLSVEKALETAIVSAIPGAGLRVASRGAPAIQPQARTEAPAKEPQVAPSRVREPSKPKPSRQGVPAQAPGIKVKALDRSTREFVEIKVASDKVTESLREERKTGVQLRLLVRCLSSASSLANCLRKSRLPSSIKTHLRQRARDGSALKAVKGYLAVVDGNIGALAQGRAPSVKPAAPVQVTKRPAPVAPAAPTVKPPQKTQFTTIPREFRGRRLYKWGNRLRLESATPKGTAIKVEGGRARKFIDERGLVRLETGNPRLLRAVKKISDEVWPVHERKGKFWPRTHYLVPKDALQLARKDVPDELGQSEVRELIDPGRPLAAVGATGQPTGEISPRSGGIRTRLRSASDLVGPETGTQAERDRAFRHIEDPEVRKRIKAARMGIDKTTLAGRLGEWWQGLVRGTQRGALQFLPRTEQFGQARSDLLKLTKARSIAQDRTFQLLSRTIKPLNSADYELFGLKVLLDDLSHETGQIPFGYESVEAVQSDKARVDSETEKNPQVTASIGYRTRMWAAVKTDYIDAMQAIGYRAGDRLKREDYFRHQVLHYMNLKSANTRGAGKRLEVPTARGFLKKRKGSQLDINANYLQAEWEVISQMIVDTHVATTIDSIRDRYDILDELQTNAKEQEGVEWQDIVPETHIAYAIRPGRTIYLAHSIQESLAQRLLEGTVAELGITAEDLRDTRAIGSEFRPLVIPKDLAQQLDALTPPPIESVFARAQAGLLRSWKAFRLLGPTSIIKYNLRNASEVEKVFTLNPSALQKVPRAIKELVPLFAGAEDVPIEAKGWAERGGTKSLIRVQEIGEVDKLKRFQRFLAQKERGPPGKVAVAPIKTWRGYWQLAGLGTDYREAILRYAAYLDYVEQMRASSDGLPRNFGASVPAEIKGIRDVRDRAYKLANDILGAYDDVSIVGQELRKRWYPFWSFQETNARAYFQGIKNIVASERLAGKAGSAIIAATGRKILIREVIRSPLRVVQLGRIGLLLYGAHAIFSSFNHIFFGDEEEELPPNVRSRPHIVLGRNKDGDVRYFSRLGTSGDFLEWFGLDQVSTDLSDLLSDRRTLREIAADAAANPANKIMQGASPFLKGPFELATKRQLFPDIRRPRPIRDRWEYIFRTYGLEQEYRALTGKPGDPYLGRRLSTLPAYTIEPNRAAYSEIQSLKSKFLKKLGKPRGFSEGGRTDALRNFRLAIRYEDEDAAQRYLAEYISMGGTPAGIKSSMKRMDPLGGLTKDEKSVFVLTLSEQDKELLRRAVRYYNEVLLGQGKSGE